MSDTAIQSLPVLHPELLLRSFGKDGQFVAKHRRLGTYYKLGEFEYFLLLQFDGQNSGRAIRNAFEQKFGEPLSRADLNEFVEMATKQGLLYDPQNATEVVVGDADDDEDYAAPAGAKRRQSILNFRYSVFDPDRLFNWLEPKLQFVWTKAFLAVSAVAILLAAVLAWKHHGELAGGFSSNLHWETAVVIWLTIITVTLLHEFAHGLTCKHFGGEVHELGVLVMFFTPCFYCNVSDAWLIPEKRRRLLITAAGAYCDLCLWALAIFVWRLTLPGSPINFVAWIVTTVCGARTLFNFNPFMKLDGYYLVSDWFEVPNLRKQAREYRVGLLQWLLWGAKRPEGVTNSTMLIIYGFITWAFSVVFLDAMLIGLFKYLGARWGWIGMAFAGWLAYVVSRNLFRGLFAGEFVNMLKNRKGRTTAWVIGLSVVAFALVFCNFEDRTSGTFEVRPAKHIEIRAMVAGFLREVHCEEGDHLSSNSLVARLEVPDLDSQIAQKTAQIHESQANLRRLTAGPRAETVHEQLQKVERMRAWRDLAEQDLGRARLNLSEELSRLDGQIRQYRAEYEYSIQLLSQATRLYERGVMAGQQYLGERKRCEVANLQLEQVHAQKRAREASGTAEAEAELARRAKDLADTEMALKLLEVGSHPEEIDAERAREARLKEELKFLTETRSKLEVRCPLNGLVTTARMKEKIGQYLEKGALICVVEDATGLAAEIALAEQDVSGVQAGQLVELKARALPFRTFQARVERVAPRASTVQGSAQGTVTVYCHLNSGDENLLAGMTGMGRISRGQEALGTIAAERAVRYFRTEFWW